MARALAPDKKEPVSIPATWEFTFWLVPSGGVAPEICLGAGNLDKGEALVRALDLLWDSFGGYAVEEPGENDHAVVPPFALPVLKFYEDCDIVAREKESGLLSFVYTDCWEMLTDADGECPK